MRMRKTVIGHLLAVLCVLVLGAGLAFGQSWTLKYGHVGPATADSDDHVSGIFLKDFLESRSRGRIKVEIYPASQLGNFRTLIESVQLGTVELAHTTVGGMNQFFPQIQVTDIPYMFRDDLVAEKVGQGWFFDDTRDAILKKTGNVRLVGVGNTGRFRSFYTTKKQIKVAADLKGVKMRTINSPLQIEMVKFLGGNPTPVAWGELYTSLATGVVEGTKNAASDIVSNKMHEALKYVVLDEHAYLYGFYWMSNSWLKSMPLDLQKLVVDGVEQMAAVQQEFNKQLDIRFLQEFQKTGGTVYIPTPEEKATFQRAKPVMRDWFTKNVDNGEFWVKKLEKAVADTEREIDSYRARVLR